jgi:hypothetical protein
LRHRLGRGASKTLRGRYFPRQGAYGRPGGPCLGGSCFGGSCFDGPCFDDTGFAEASDATGCDTHANNEDFAGPLPDLVRVPVHEDIGDRRRVFRQTERIAAPEESQSQVLHRLHVRLCFLSLLRVVGVEVFQAVERIRRRQFARIACDSSVDTASQLRPHGIDLTTDKLARGTVDGPTRRVAHAFDETLAELDRGIDQRRPLLRITGI